MVTPWFRVTIALASIAACHVIERNELVRPGTSERVTLRDRPIARRATIALTDTGKLRFVEPLDCPTENIVSQTAGTEILTKPNLATFVVGIVATSVGAIAAIRGLTDSDPGGSPFTYAGLGLVGAGLPFTIGPWLGNRTELVPGAPRPSVRTPGPAESCGERPVNAKFATLRARGVEIHGTIDGDGVFSVSPYTVVDAFETSTVAAWDISATLDGDRTKQVAAMIDGGSLATRARVFLLGADFDAKIEPMRLVPGLVPSTFRIGMTADAQHIRMVLPIKNDGPGPAWAVRAHVIAPGQPAIDGRVIYLGAIAKGAAREGVLVIPISPDASGALRNAAVDISIELRDAHGTAPSTPIRYRGPVIVDPTR
ncbi:MAG: hypothetical protein H0V17_08980 [Deltaproteobacteria bacterium]|nr:hypothetical protein [Deltaproteobacteria bacterium]